MVRDADMERSWKLIKSGSKMLVANIKKGIPQHIPRFISIDNKLSQFRKYCLMFLRNIFYI